MYNFDIMRLAIGALMVFTVFPVRQYARNWMAVKLGDDTPEREGKLTLNPFAHADIFGIIFMIIIFARRIRITTKRIIMHMIYIFIFLYLESL